MYGKDVLMIEMSKLVMKTARFKPQIPKRFDLKFLLNEFAERDLFNIKRMV